MNTREICKKAVITFGKNIQIVIIMEELSELIQQCSKYIRNDMIDNSIDVVPLILEIADVEIMIEQLKYIISQEFSGKRDFLDYRLRESKKSKLERLQKRIEKYILKQKKLIKINEY